MFLGLNKQPKVPIISKLRRDYINQSPEDYIGERYKRVYNQRDKGKPKYQHLLKQELTKDELEDLMIRLKYIALCMSGQLDPDRDGFYESYGDIQKTTINFNSQTNKDVKTLLENVVHNQFYL